MKKTVKSICVITLIAAINLFYGIAFAQTYPTKPIRLIVPFPPGGSTDITGRMIAAKLAERLGKQLIVENRGGAGAVLGTEVVANSKPDGYTLLFISSSHAMNPSLHKLPYDQVKAFIPVAKLGSGPGVLTVHPELPIKTVKELIAYAKEKPGKLISPTSGSGTFMHLGIELLKIMTDIDFKIIHFKGGGPAIIDQLGGHSHLSYGTLMQALPHIKGGKLRAIGVGGLKRHISLSEVPTVAEAGVPGYEASNWWGILAPAGTPKEIIDKLQKELSVIMSSAEIKKMFQDKGAEADMMDSREFGPYITAETNKWARVIKKAGIKTD
ncbi:MAG: tripartite tricarboxylate transporter substrate binding protein [Pseudomonadota bacterium]